VTILNFFRISPTYYYCRTYMFCWCVMPSVRFGKVCRPVSDKLWVWTHLINGDSDWQLRYVTLRYDADISCHARHISSSVHLCKYTALVFSAEIFRLRRWLSSGRSPWWWKQQAPLKLRYTSTRLLRNNPEHNHLHTRHRENVKSNRFWLHIKWKYLRI
jgi:hypothetical protein